MNNRIGNRTGYKETKIGSIPEDWGIVNLLDLTENGISNGVFNEPNKVGTGYRLINVIDLYKEPMIDVNSLALLNIDQSEFERNKVKWGDIFFTRSSLKLEGIAQCNINLSEYDDITFDGHVMKLSPKKDLVNPSFLRAYCLSKHARLYFITHAKQTTMTTIGQSEIGNLPIPLPPLPEQKKIAEILSTWDRAIEKTEKLVDAKTKLKKGLMQQLLTHKKKLGKSKSDWSKVKIEDIFDRITTKNSVNNQNILTVSAQQGFIKQNLFFNKRIASELLHDYFLVEKGDFVYNKSYSNGYPLGAIKRLNDSDSGVVTTLYICFRGKDSDLISSDFYEHYFEAGLINESLTRVAHEGGRAHGLLNITPNDFFNIEIDFPPIEEQNQIATIMSTADREINLLKTKLKALKQQKKGLMQKLLTGEVRVKV